MSLLTPTNPPYMNFHETTSNPFVDGEGSEIPVFIGKSPNTGDATKIITYKNYASVKKTVVNGGLGLETAEMETTNPLLYAVKDFFAESARQKDSDIGVPRVYVIDLGASPTAEMVITSLEQVKKVREISVVGFVGIELERANQVALMQSVWTDLTNDTKNGRFKIAYFEGKKGATEEELATFSDNTQETSIQENRVAVIEYNKFGKDIARICVTPYYVEPGYAPFNTIDLGVFKTRNPEERKQLFDAGVIFGEDDYTLEEPVARICAGTTTAFGKDVDERPNDCLLHARRNADHQIRELLKIIAPQLKRNETQTNVRYIQADCESYLEKEKGKGRLMDYDVSVAESDDNPYSLIVEGSVTPVNSTYAIDVSCYISSPNTLVSEEI